MVLEFGGTISNGIVIPPLSIRRGEVVGLSGRSGAGKTRLMRALADLDHSTGLNTSLNGILRQKVAWSEWRCRIHYCAAVPAWWEEDRIEELFTTDSELALLEATGLGKELWAMPLRDLSTGQQQRAHVVRSLARRADFLMFDEPTSALDKGAVATMERLISATSNRAAVIFSSHDFEQIQRLSTRHWSFHGNRLEDLNDH